MLTLFPHQIDVVKKLFNGSILWGSVGSGKSIAAIAYYIYSCTGIAVADSGQSKKLAQSKNLKKLVVITTANKRDSKDWEKDYRTLNLLPNMLTVDSWNNVNKYKDFENCFFIFDEQKVIGSGSWSKGFIKITKKNSWILATATPGDVWSDYIPIFIANGFYKNRTQFTTEHVVYAPYSKYPKILRYENENRLEQLKSRLLVEMEYENKTISYVENVHVEYDKDLYKTVLTKRWNVFKNEPLKQSSDLYHILRRVVNSDSSRLIQIRLLQEKHKRLIVFYTFDYELEILRSLTSFLQIPIKEYNGHNHDSLPEGEEWVYLVQYVSGSEAWNCVTTNAIAYYSLSYSYKMTSQAGGRIDRANTPYSSLYYYYLTSDAPIDKLILSALSRKEDFNEKQINEKRDLASIS